MDKYAQLGGDVHDLSTDSGEEERGQQNEGTTESVPNLSVTESGKAVEGTLIRPGTMGDDAGSEGAPYPGTREGRPQESLTEANGLNCEINGVEDNNDYNGAGGSELDRGLDICNSKSVRRLQGDAHSREGDAMDKLRIQQTKALTLYGNLTSRVELEARLVGGANIMRPSEDQLKTSLRAKSDRQLLNRITFRSRASWAETTLRVVGPEVWNEADDLTTLKEYLGLIKIIPKFVSLGARLRPTSDDVEFDPQSVELSLAGNVRARNGEEYGTAVFTDGAYWTFETLCTIASIKHTRVNILHSDGDSRWEIENEKVVKPMVNSIVDWCAKRVNQAKGGTIGEYMKRKRGENFTMSKGPPSLHKDPPLETLNQPTEDMGWNCGECNIENDPDDDVCWACGQGTKASAEELKTLSDSQSKLMKLATGSRSPARGSRSRSPPGSPQAMANGITILKRQPAGEWKTGNPFAPLSVTDDLDSDQDISIVVGKGGEQAGKGGLEIMVQQFATERSGRMSPPRAGPIRGIPQWVHGIHSKGRADYKVNEGETAAPVKLQDGVYEDEYGNSMLYEQVSPHNKKGRAIVATFLLK